MQAALAAPSRVSGLGELLSKPCKAIKSALCGARRVPLGHCPKPSHLPALRPAVSAACAQNHHVEAHNSPMQPSIPTSEDATSSFVGSTPAGRRQAAAGGRSRRSVAVLAAGGDSKQGQRQPWEFGRFLDTVLYFNRPPSPADIIRKLFGSSAAPSASASSAAATMGNTVQTLIPASGGAQPSEPGVVLVTGATGGTGRRVVARLLARGRRVRALVRDVQKARQLLAGLPAGAGGSLELVAADVTQVCHVQPRGKLRGSQVVSRLSCQPQQPAPVLVLPCSTHPPPLFTCMRLLQRQTLLPEMFEGVRQVVSCSAVTVAPKEVRTSAAQPGSWTATQL